MSLQLINRSPDLKRLRDEGYNIEIRSNHLLIHDVPYVDSKQKVQRGILASTLTLAGDVTASPKNHVALFAGEHPCNADGSIIAGIKHQSRNQKIDDTITVNHSFSARPKPKNKYDNYYDKMSTYVAIISKPANAIDPTVSARTYAVVEQEEDNAVFKYIDTASSRAGINAVTNRLCIDRIAIIGLGGTGSYVLDLVAKTPVGEIHLYDGDKFLSHNAFRAPGAPSVEKLRAQPMKANYFQDLYSSMRRNIVAHTSYIDESNVEQLQKMDFVFLCMDSGSAKKLIIDRLEESNIPFIDVGMGIQLVDNALLGILRVTSSTPEKRDHLKEMGRIHFSDHGGDNDYATNIQVADLNALNAALAVVKWKKILGFYVDLDKEHHSTYTIDGNLLTNEDRP